MMTAAWAWQQRQGRCQKILFNRAIAPPAPKFGKFPRQRDAGDGRPGVLRAAQGLPFHQRNADAGTVNELSDRCERLCDSRSQRGRERSCPECSGAWLIRGNSARSSNALSSMARALVSLVRWKGHRLGAGVCQRWRSPSAGRSDRRPGAAVIDRDLAPQGARTLDRLGGCTTAGGILARNGKTDDALRNRVCKPAASPPPRHS
jgi:hypothetical protein